MKRVYYALGGLVLVAAMGCQPEKGAKAFQCDKDSSQAALEARAVDQLNERFGGRPDELFGKIERKDRFISLDGAPIPALGCDADGLAGALGPEAAAALLAGNERVYACMLHDDGMVTVLVLVFTDLECSPSGSDEKEDRVLGGVGSHHRSAYSEAVDGACKAVGHLGCVDAFIAHGTPIEVEVAGELHAFPDASSLQAQLPDLLAAAFLPDLTEETRILTLPSFSRQSFPAGFSVSLESAGGFRRTGRLADAEGNLTWRSPAASFHLTLLRHLHLAAVAPGMTVDHRCFVLRHEADVAIEAGQAARLDAVRAYFIQQAELADCISSTGYAARQRLTPFNRYALCGDSYPKSCIEATLLDPAASDAQVVVGPWDTRAKPASELLVEHIDTLLTMYRPPSEAEALSGHDWRAEPLPSEPLHVEAFAVDAATGVATRLPEARADAAGKVALTALDPGHYRLVASRHLYVLGSARDGTQVRYCVQLRSAASIHVPRSGVKVEAEPIELFDIAAVSPEVCPD